MYKIAFLGDKRLLSFYKPLGFVIFSPTTVQEVKSTLTSIQQENYAIAFVTESIYKMAKDIIDEYNSSFLPSITVIPGYGEDEGLGMDRLEKLVENAVGMKLDL